MEIQGLPSSCAITVMVVILGAPGNLIGPGSGLLNQQVRHVSLLFLAVSSQFFITLHWAGALPYFLSSYSFLAAPLQNHCALLQTPKAQHMPVMWLNNSITKIIPRGMNTFSTKIHMWNFHNSFIHNSLKLKQNYPSTGEWINYGIYSTAIKRTFSNIWNNLDKSHRLNFEWKYKTQKKMFYMILFI